MAGPTTRLRQALYLGYDRLMDRPLNAMEPHYIPVIARREGGDGSPYGYIRNMKSPNEAYNQRYARVLHDLSGRRVIASEDAVVDHEATRRDINKNNAYILLKSGNLENERFEIVTNVDMTQISMALMENARRDIHAASGIPQEFVGAQRARASPVSRSIRWSTRAAKCSGHSCATTRKRAGAPPSASSTWSSRTCTGRRMLKCASTRRWPKDRRPCS